MLTHSLVNEPISNYKKTAASGTTGSLRAAWLYNMPGIHVLIELRCQVLRSLWQPRIEKVPKVQERDSRQGQKVHKQDL